MNQRQHEKARQLLSTDCALAKRYVKVVKGQEPQTCAIGCLALAAGIKPKFFLDGHRNNKRITHDLLNKVSKAIQKEFGLSPDEQQSIQWSNDSLATNREMRVHDVLAKLDHIRERHKELK